MFFASQATHGKAKTNSNARNPASVEASWNLERGFTAWVGHKVYSIEM